MGKRNLIAYFDIISTMILTLKEKLKYLYNCKWLWITAFCLVQIAFVSANIYYYSRTKYCCDIYITSTTDCEVSFVTPIGTTYTQNVEANVKFREYKRPLAEVHAPNCATVEFSSDEVSISDIFIFTMKVKRLYLLWVGLTCPCLILLSRKRIWMSLVIVQIPFIVIFVFLYFNINYYCGITVFSPHECVVNTTSPLGVNTEFYVSANEDLYIDSEAIKDIEIPEYATICFDSDKVSIIDIFDYYCKQRLFFCWFMFTFGLLFSLLIRSWLPNQNKI